MDSYSYLWFLAGTILPSLVVAWLAGYGVRHFAPQWGLVDQPGERKVHTVPTPLGGGLAIWLGVVVPLSIGEILLAWILNSSEGEKLPEWLPEIVRQHAPGIMQQTGKLWAVVGTGTVLMLLGLADDRWQLDWKPRLGVQFVVAIAVVVGLDLRLTAYLDLPWLTIGLSVLWIAALVNAFNMLDNMDGLSAGVGQIAALALAAVMLLAPDPETNRPQLFIAGYLLVLVGALAGFLWHNRTPAQLFMGDAGSYFLGFSLATMTVLATYAGQSPERRHQILAPLCVMAVPLYDLVSVILIRIYEGRSPFQADKRHFSHRLVALGFTKSEAVWTIYLLSAICGLAAIVLHRVDGLGAGLIAAMVLLVLGLIATFETIAGRKLE